MNPNGIKKVYPVCLFRESTKSYLHIKIPALNKLRAENIIAEDYPGWEAECWLAPEIPHQ